MGWIGVAGCALVSLAILIAPAFVPDYDWIRDTISDLAAGDSKWIVDYGLYAFAAGLAATAFGMWHVHPGGRGWTAASVAIGVAALAVLVIGARDEYGDGDTGGLVIHSYVVMAYGLAMAVAAFAAAPSAAAARGWFRPALIGLGLLWCLASPYFFFMGTSWDGLYERGLGVIAAAITVILDRVLVADPEA